jgi:hypothetical protein
MLVVTWHNIFNRFINIYARILRQAQDERTKIVI